MTDEELEMRLMCEVEQLRTEIRELRDALDRFYYIACNSTGVIGRHVNGDVAMWHHKFADTMDAAGIALGFVDTGKEQHEEKTP